MKAFQLLALAAFSLPLTAVSRMRVIDVYCDGRDNMVHVLSADETEINKTLPWKPDQSKEAVPLPKLIAIAKSRLKLPSNYEVDPRLGLLRITWRPCDYGWILEIVFYFRPKPEPNKVMVRDGDGNVTIKMLPNGAAITETTRKATPEELDGRTDPPELKELGETQK